MYCLIIEYLAYITGTLFLISIIQVFSKFAVSFVTEQPIEDDYLLKKPIILKSPLSYEMESLADYGGILISHIFGIALWPITLCYILTRNILIFCRYVYRINTKLKEHINDNHNHR